jgi:hypothetical protein
VAGYSQSTEALVSSLGGAKKTKVDGNTVTLTADTAVKTAIEVPEGVTLDLTTGKVKLILQNGATLTVNGTINTRGGVDINKSWVEGGIKIEKGTVTINGSGTIYLKSKGRMLSVWGGKLTIDGVTLVGLADNNDSLMFIGDGIELILKSGKITGNTHIPNVAWALCGGINVYKSKFTMEGGTISGIKGHAVSVSESSFTLKNGEISGNSPGGVSVFEKGTFIMEGGVITGGFQYEKTNGYGVAAETNGTFIMKGGVIHGNKGTGLVISGGKFTMEGGRIQGSKNSDGFTANTDTTGNGAAALIAKKGMGAKAPVSKWGTGGTYTNGGVSQAGGSDISDTNDTLIAIPKN